MWSIQDSPKCLLDLSLDLEQDEVWLAVCQSLYQEKEGDLIMQFPLSISSDCRFVAILRTVYTTATSDQSGTIELKAHTLALDFNEHIKAYWRENPRIRQKASGTFVPHNYQYPNIYSYAIAFSRDAHLVSFSDAPFVARPNIALFERTNLRTYDWALKSFLTGAYADQRITSFIGSKVVLHPFAPLALIIFHPEITLWEYEGEHVFLSSCFNN